MALSQPKSDRSFKITVEGPPPYLDVALARPNKQFNTALSLQTARVVLNDMSDGRSAQHDKVMGHAEVGPKPIRPSMTCFTLYVEYATSEVTAAVVALLPAGIVEDGDDAGNSRVVTGTIDQLATHLGEETINLLIRETAGLRLQEPFEVKLNAISGVDGVKDTVGSFRTTGEVLIKVVSATAAPVFLPGRGTGTWKFNAYAKKLCKSCHAPCGKQNCTSGEQCAGCGQPHLYAECPTRSRVVPADKQCLVCSAYGHLWLSCRRFRKLVSVSAASVRQELTESRMLPRPRANGNAPAASGSPPADRVRPAPGPRLNSQPNAWSNRPATTEAGAAPPLGAQNGPDGSAALRRALEEIKQLKQANASLTDTNRSLAMSVENLTSLSFKLTERGAPPAATRGRSRPPHAAAPAAAQPAGLAEDPIENSQPRTVLRVRSKSRGRNILAMVAPVLDNSVPTSSAGTPQRLQGSAAAPSPGLCPAPQLAQCQWRRQTT